MSIDISIEIKAEYLYVLVTGVHDVDVAIDLLDEVLKTSVRYKLHRILIDFRQLQNEFPLKTETYIYAASVAQLIQKHIAAIGQPLRIAYLGPETSSEGESYGEEVAARYGFHGGKRVSNMDEALEWLGVRRTKE